MIGTIVAIGVLCVAAYIAWDVYQLKSNTVAQSVASTLDAESIDLMNAAVRQVKDVLDRARDIEDYEDAITKLKTELGNLAAAKADRDAGFARERTDIEHKVGLLKQQHEQELTLSKRDAVLTVREENLTKDQQRFADQMEFERDQMKGEMDGLRTLTSQLLERLPDVKALIRNG